MRIISYVLVQLAPGKAREAARTISKIPGVKMAHAVTGPFDVTVFADLPDLASLSDLVLSRIQNVRGVEKTQTAVVVASEPLPNIESKQSSGRSLSGIQRLKDLK
jgi:DNA-binding Lrp family transcriptional regulator